MVHARNVKPPVAGAKLVSIDESSVRSMPGFVKVVSKGNYVAVVCEREEQAIRAARQLKVNWQKPATAPFPASEDLFTYMRSATPTSSGQPTVVGDPDAALAGAATVVEAEYDVPFQGHTAFGPAHAMADPSNGQMTIYSNDMKSYGMRNGVAAVPGDAARQVRVVWMEGPQGYGRTAADDAGFEAAFLAKEIGRPVRVQWMRHEETAWDTKGPAFAFKMRGGARCAGQPGRARLRRARRRLQSPRLQRARHRADRAADGHRGARRRRAGSAATPSEMYAIPNRRMADAGREPAAGVGDAAAHRQPARSERPAGDVRLRVVHRRAGRGGQGRSGRVPPEAAHRQHRRRQRVQAGALDRRASRRRRRRTAGTRVRRRSRAAPATILTGRGIAYAFRSQTVVARDRRGRGEPPHRPRLGEAAGLRARLRAGDQPRGAAPHARGRHAALAEPRAARGSAVRHREGDERGLGLASRR